MKHTDNGIELTKAEVAALLAFTADEPQRSDLYGVKFRVSESHVHARASNGHIAIDVVGMNDDGSEHEWFVHRDFLRGAAKMADAKGAIYLMFSGASLNDARMVNEDGLEIATFSWPTDAANAQASFPDDALEKLLEPPSGKATKSSTLDADYLGLMKTVAKAAGVSGVTCYPPPKSDQRIMFRCEGVDTTWVALVMPMRGIDGDEDEPGCQRHREKKKKNCADCQGGASLVEG